MSDLWVRVVSRTNCFDVTLLGQIATALVLIPNLRILPLL